MISTIISYADSFYFPQYIDREELDKVLTETITMFTPKQIDEIFKEIDQDNSNTVDFSEVLVVCFCNLPSTTVIKK